MKRRDFLKVIGLSGAVVGSGAGLIVAATPKELPMKLPTEMVTHPLFSKGGQVPPCYELEDAVLVSESQNFDCAFVEMDYSKMLDEYLKREGLDFRSVPGRLPDDDYKETQMYISFLVADGRINRAATDLTHRYISPSLMTIARMMEKGHLYPSPRLLYAHRSMGLLCHVSEGGQVPLRCTMNYDVKRQGIMVVFDTLVLEA